MISRAERTPLSEWWWTVDKPLLFAVVALMLGGIVLSLAASPGVAERLDLDLFHFVNRQVMFLVPAAAVMFAVSLLGPRGIRRAALVVFLIFWPAMILALFIGPEIKGAHRWLQVGPFGVQPSEFVKPGFIILAAWLFAEGARRDDVPGHAMAILLFGMVVGSAVGAIGGAFRDYGIDDNFIRSIRGAVTPGSSALFLMTSDAVLDRVVKSMQSLDFEIIATNLSAEQEHTLRELFAQ